MKEWFKNYWDAAKFTNKIDYLQKYSSDPKAVNKSNQSNIINQNSSYA